MLEAAIRDLAAIYLWDLANAASRTINNNEKVVGETGFEPATPWTQTKCATKLRYSPTNP